jgi:hypothetical protein
MAFASSFDTSSMPTYDEIASIGAISVSDFEKLSQEEKGRYELTQYIVPGKPDPRYASGKGPASIRWCYVPRNTIVTSFVPVTGIDPPSDDSLFRMDTPWPTDEWIIEFYKRCAIDAAKRAINYIKHYNNSGKEINIDDLASLVINDYNSRKVWQEGKWLGLVPGESVHRQMDEGTNNMLRGYAREAIETGVNIAVDLIKEEMSKQAANSSAASDIKPLSAGIGTVGTIGIIALLGLSLRTMMQKRRK